MPELVPGSLAIITGGASGLGFVMAQKLGASGLHIAILDIEETVLRLAVEELQGSMPAAQHVAGYVCDVSSLASVEAAAANIQKAFPGKDIGFVAANAGVVGGSLLGSTEKDWDFNVDVNLKGVAWTMRTFVPLMQKQTSQSIFCATASIAGIVAFDLGIYGVTKHAVVAMCDILKKELANANSNHVFVHCLCPAISNTAITNSSRNRNIQYGPEAVQTADEESFHDAYVGFFREHGESASSVVGAMLESVRDRKFYTILDNTEGFTYGMKERIAERLAGQITGYGSLGPTFFNENIQKYIAKKTAQKAQHARAKL